MCVCVCVSVCILLRLMSESVLPMILLGAVLFQVLNLSLYSILSLFLFSGAELL